MKKLINPIRLMFCAIACVLIADHIRDWQIERLEGQVCDLEEKIERLECNTVNAMHVQDEELWKVRKRVTKLELKE